MARGGLSSGFHTPVRPAIPWKPPMVLSLARDGHEAERFRLARTSRIVLKVLRGSRQPHFFTRVSVVYQSCVH